MPRDRNRSIGSVLRDYRGGLVFKLLAPIYRRFFFSIKLFVRLSLPNLFSGSILDVGGGDGSVLVEVLKRHTPKKATFVDPTPTAGSLILHTNIVKYVGLYLQEIHEIQNEKFDLILLVDVLHHVQPQHRQELLDLTIKMLTTDGKLLVKEVGIKGMKSKLTYWADVYISKDPVVSFISEEKLRALINEIDPKIKVISNEIYNKKDYPNYCVEVSFGQGEKSFE